MYGQAKLDIEKEAIRLGASVVRPGLIYGEQSGLSWAARPIGPEAAGIACDRKSRTASVRGARGGSRGASESSVDCHGTPTGRSLPRQSKA